MEPKRPNASEWGPISQFLNQELRSDIKWSLHDEYPLAFDEKNRGNIRIISDGQEILSHAVLKPTLIKTPYHLFKVGFLGSVVTSEKHRGNGYSKEVINSCLEASDAQGCDFTILWTNLFDFYSKLGFEVAGSEVALQMNAKFSPKENDGIKILNTPNVSPQALLRIYNKHSLRTLRTEQDVSRYLKIPNSSVYTAWNKATNELEAYCIVGKGADFGGFIHEWGGKVSSLLTLTKHIVDDTKKTIHLITPPQCTNLIRQAEECGATQHIGVLGMIKLVNPLNFAKKINKGARSMGYDAFVFDYRDGIYYFGYGSEIYQTDSDQDIVRLVFGPLTPGQIHPFSPQALEALNDIFPIPFWVWGWDSI